MEKQFKMTEAFSVVVAEDDPVFTLILKRFLDEIGLNVNNISQTETEVVDLCKSYQPDLIILDVHLKKGNGLIARKRIREFSQTPILMITGSTPDVVPDLAGLDYIIKPFLFKDFRTKIANMIEYRQQQANS